MIRKWFLLLSVIFISTNIFSQTKTEKNSKPGQEIIFTKQSWNGALKEARRTGKYLFVDANTAWCSPCKLLKSTTFKNKNVADFFNKHFINLSIDMEKGEGLTLADKWSVDTYPTLIIFDSQGKMIQKETGYMESGDLFSFAQKVFESK